MHVIFFDESQECIEYYGARRGLDICKDYYDDFLECGLKQKQVSLNDSDKFSK